MTPAARLQKGLEAIREGRIPDALDLAEQMLAGEGDEVITGHLLAGVAYADATSWPDAEDHLLQALAGELGTEKARALYHLGRTYEHMRRPQLAANLYGQAGELWRQAGKHLNAAKAAQNACWLLTYYGLLDEAQTHLRAAADEPDLAEEQQALTAYLHLRRAEHEVALDHAMTVMETGFRPWPKCLAAYIGGMVAIEAQQLDLARRFYEDGSSLLPRAADVRLIRVYAELRRALS